MRKCLFLLAIILIWSCNDNDQNEKRINGTALGTTYQIIYFDDLDEEVLTKAMDSLLNAVNSSLSTYQSDSDISKLNWLSEKLLSTQEQSTNSQAYAPLKT